MNDLIAFIAGMSFGVFVFFYGWASVKWRRRGLRQ